MSKFYKTLYFERWQYKNKLSDKALLTAIDEINNGLFEANLGSNVYKKRIAGAGKGKRGAYRTIVASKVGDKAFFLYGYAKNRKATINDKELKAYRSIASTLFAINDAQLISLLNKNELYEVINE